MLGAFNWAPTAGQLALGASAPAVLGSSARPAPGWAGVAGRNSVLHGRRLLSSALRLL